MARVLVVYYSRTGTTKKVALAIAQALSADLEQIADPMPRGGVLGWLKCGFDATFKRCTPIAPPKLWPGIYDLVVIGSPTWNGSIASPVRTYLMRERLQLGAVAFFSTCGGRGADAVVAEMAEVSGHAPTATLELKESEVLGGLLAEKVAPFVRAVTDAVEDIQRRNARPMSAVRVRHSAA